MASDVEQLRGTLTKVKNIRVPPHSNEAEQSVLGGLMLDNQAWDKVVDHVRLDDFYRAEHRLIFNSISELIKRDRPIDVLTVSERLKSCGELDDAGGEVYLFELANNTPSASNIQAYAHIVHERALLRQLIHAATTITDTAFKPEGRESTAILDEAERLIFEISEGNQRGTGPQDVNQLLALSMEKIEALFHSDSAITGLASGFTDFDDMTSGLQASDLVVVAGRPSMGKTVFGVNLAENVAIESGRPVLIFSLEMPGEQIAMRMMSSLGRINQQQLRSGKLSDADWPRLTSSMNILADKKILVDDTAALSPQEIRSRARRVHREYGDLGLIVVDYLQLMSIPGFKEGRTGEISEISRSLKALAKELNVPVIALSQLNRSLEQRSDKRPIMSDLRESGAIEQDADVIVFIYRDEVYNEDSPDKGTAEIIIAKQRNGPIGKVRLTFQGQYTRFDNYSAEF